MLAAYQDIQDIADKLAQVDFQALVDLVASQDLAAQ